MLQFEELRLTLEKLRPDISDLAGAFGLQNMKGEISQLDERTAMPGFWDDMERSQKILQCSNMLKNKVANYEKLCSFLEDALALVKLADEAEDLFLLSEAQQEYRKIQTGLEAIRLTTLLRGEYDAKNMILTFHVDAGGTEAQGWVSMLYRMYYRWAERHGFQVKTPDYLDEEEAGSKSTSILIEGINAYGLSKSEVGVHHLVCVFPSGASGRRHIPFASFEVILEADSDTSVEISPDDIKMQVYHASDASGQKINKTSSAVRLTHKPIDIVVSCQAERNQYQNRDVVMKMLISELAEIKKREHLEKIEDIKGDQKEIAWGSQICSHVFTPYTLAKDHRTGLGMGNISVMVDGDLDDFINAYLKTQNFGTLGENIE